MIRTNFKYKKVQYGAYLKNIRGYVVSIGNNNDKEIDFIADATWLREVNFLPLHFDPSIETTPQVSNKSSIFYQ